MDKYQIFLNSFFEEIAKVGLNIDGLNLDHIAYQASTSEDYDQKKPQFSNLGTEISEEIIGGRRVAVYELFEPIRYKDYVIPALELIEPKPDQDYSSDFQHAEFVTAQPFETYIEQYPTINWDTSSMSRDEFSHLKINFENGLTLKFLHTPILELLKRK